LAVFERSEFVKFRPSAWGIRAEVQRQVLFATFSSKRKWGKGSFGTRSYFLL